MPVDRQQIRAEAELAKKSAKDSIASETQKAMEAKLRLKHPPPSLVKMPEPTGDPVTDSDADLDAVKTGFRNRAKSESERFLVATDSEFWCCFCFQTREQKDAFLAQLDLLKFGDKYIDGAVAAKVLGIKLPEAKVAYNTSNKIDKRWLEFTKD